MIDNDVRDTIIVDNFEKLSVVEDVFKHVKWVGVDLEGKLRDGRLWLA